MKNKGGSAKSLQSNMKQGAKTPHGKSDPGDLRETMHQGDRPDRSPKTGKLGSIMHQ